MSTIPNMYQIISYYLYGQITKPEDALDERIVNRHKDDSLTIPINALEFMTTGAGRYAQVGNFLAVRKFLAGEYNSFLVKGASYSFSSLLKEVNPNASGNLDMTAEFTVYSLKDALGKMNTGAAGEKTGLNRVKERDAANMAAIDEAKK